MITLSTIPSRIAHLKPVLRSLLAQTEPPDRILLCLPRFSARENRPYPAASDLDLPSGVDVLETSDHGPATKLLPALLAEPEALLVVVDDDAVYPETFLATLLVAHRQNPRAALGLRGVVLAKGTQFVELPHVFGSAVDQSVPVDVLFGTWGYLLPPSVLDGAVQELEAAPEQLRWVDDVWVSGHLARRGIARLVIPSQAFPIETPNAARSSLSGGLNRPGSNEQRAIDLFATDGSPRP